MVLLEKDSEKVVNVNNEFLKIFNINQSENQDVIDFQIKNKILKEFKTEEVNYESIDENQEFKLLDVQNENYKYFEIINNQEGC